MLYSLLSFLRIVSRERPGKNDLKPEKRFRLTLDLKKVRPGARDGDVSDWLMKLGLVPTGNPSIWKATQSALSRVPKAAIVKWV